MSGRLTVADLAAVVTSQGRLIELLQHNQTILKSIAWDQEQRIAGLEQRLGAAVLKNILQREAPAS